MTAQLIDFAGRPPTPAGIAAAGYAGALRYLAPLPNPKAATRGEVDADIAAGLSIGLVWEAGARNALGGTVKGHLDGAEAARQAKALGAPDGVCIFFAVDFDAWPAAMSSIGDYLEAARVQCSSRRYRVGVYGSAAVCEAMLAGDHVDLAWQTVAWSHGVHVHDGRVVLYQRVGQVTVDGTTCDVNDVLASDWGGWHAPAAPLPPLEPPTHYPKDAMTRTPVRIITDAQGRGYTDLGVPARRVVSIVPGGDDPGDGWGPHLQAPPYAIDHAGTARIVVPASPVISGSVDVVVWVADQ